MSGKSKTIETKIKIEAPIDAVWKALTDAEELTRWFPMQARVNPGPGGSIWQSWRGEWEAEAKIEVWEPQQRLVYSYPTPTDVASGKQADAIRTAVDFRLEGRGGSTVLRLVHSGFGGRDGWETEYDGTRRGWAFELRGLRHYLERHRGIPRRTAWVKRSIAVSFEAGWRRLIGPQGIDRDGSLGTAEEGGRYAIRTATGESFEGVIGIFGPPNDLSGTAENWNAAYLRIAFEPDYADPAGPNQVNLWLSTYGLAEEKVTALEKSWSGLLEKLFPEPAGTD